MDCLNTVFKLLFFGDHQGLTTLADMLHEPAAHCTRLDSDLKTLGYKGMIQLDCVLIRHQTPHAMAAVLRTCSA